MSNNPSSTPGSTPGNNTNDNNANGAPGTDFSSNTNNKVNNITNPLFEVQQAFSTLKRLFEDACNRSLINDDLQDVISSDLKKLEGIKELEDIHLVTIYGYIGMIYYAQKEYGKFLEAQDKVIPILVTLRMNEELAGVYMLMGHTHYEQGDYPKASASFNLAIPILKELQMMQELIQAYHMLEFTDTTQG